MAGEMTAAEVTREEYPLHFAIADVFGGEVKPFDQYQGPYIAIGPDYCMGTAPYRVPVQGLGFVRLWICSDDGCSVYVHNESSEESSEKFPLMYDENVDAAQAVAAASEVLPLDGFTIHYMICALWSSLESDGETPLDEHYDIGDFSSEAVEQIKADCLAFQTANDSDLEEYCERLGYVDTGMQHAGHDFWLTRNGHGAGFWDRGLDDLGDLLTVAAKSFGECSLYIGDDGLISLE